ncbi:MAG: hypothetical protein ACFFBV_15790, partial [Promethearchaeota archaeon]
MVLLIIQIGLHVIVIFITSQEALKNGAHFSEMQGGEINLTEMVATIITQGSSFKDGIQLQNR